MSDKSAAERLAELTGRDKSEFVYDGKIPDFEQQDLEVQDDSE